MTTDVLAAHRRSSGQSVAWDRLGGDVRVTLELFATDEHIEGCLHAPHCRPIDFSGVLGLLNAIEQLDVDPPPVAPPKRRSGAGALSS